MKKRIFLTMLLVLTLCLLFALAVSAEEIELVDNLGDPSWYTGNYELIKDKTSKVVLSNGDGTYTAYPAYYVLKYSITVNDGAVTEAYVNGFDYSFINEKTGKSYEAGAIYKIKLPEGLTRLTSGTFGHNPKEPNVVELVLSNTIVKIDDHALRQTKNLKKVVVSKNITYVGAYAFYQSKALEEVIFPEGSNDEVNMSGSNMFVECTSLKALDLSKKNIKVLGQTFLTDCTSLGKVTLPDTLEEIGYCSLYKNPNMYLASDFLPKNLKTVGFHFLSGCKNINKVLYFPDGFEGFVSNYNFSSDKEIAPELTLVFLGKVSGTWNFEQVHVNSGRKLTFIFTKNQFSDLSGKVVQACDDGTLAYIGKTADTSDTDYWVQEGTLTINVGNASESSGKYKVDENGNTLYYVNSNSYKFYFCGGDKVEVCYGVRSNVVNSEWGKHFTTPFTFDKEGHMDAGVHYDLTKVESIVNCGYDGVTSHTCVLCGRVVNDIVSATGDHTLTEVSACADKCEVCLKFIQKETQNHSCVEVFTYENGFNYGGLYGSKCENEGCTYLVAEEMEALVEDLGFSVPEEGSFRGITYGYKANKATISEYERVNGCKISLGILVVGAERFVLDKDVIDHTFVVMLDMVELVINYGETTDYDDNDVVMAGCVVEKYGKEIKKTYFQTETDKETTDYTSPTYGTLYGISYSDLK